LTIVGAPATGATGAGGVVEALGVGDGDGVFAACAGAVINTAEATAPVQAIAIQRTPEAIGTAQE
jgi:hypothetical protein